MIDLHRYQGLIGIAVLLAMALAMSNNRRRIDWKLVAAGLVLQLAFALVILRTPVGEPFFKGINSGVERLLAYAGEGSAFLFRPFGETAIAPPLLNMAFIVLPAVIFFSGLLAVLYHVGLMQWFVRGIAWLMQRTMGTSGAETLSVAGNIFVGQTESPLLVRPFLRGMTQSELMAVMVGGFATIAGGVFALYVGFLNKVLPDIAGHLAAASVMSAPAALVMAKIIYPETERPVTLNAAAIHAEKASRNVVDAFGAGVTQGLTLALNIGAMLIAFVAAVALINGLLALATPTDWEPLSMQRLLGDLFRPLAWCLGAPWEDSATLGTLLGEKLVLTELVAYEHLSRMQVGTEISERTALIASYALCGFANFASVGVQLGGLGSLAPERKGDIAALILRAMIGGALASWMTAAIAGLLL